MFLVLISEFGGNEEREEKEIEKNKIIIQPNYPRLFLCKSYFP